MCAVARVMHVNFDLDIEEIGLAMVHPQADNVAAGLADHRTDLAQHTRCVADGGGEPGPGNGVSLGLRRPLQVAPEFLAVFEFGQFLTVNGMGHQALALILQDTDNTIAGYGRATRGEVQGQAGLEPGTSHIEACVLGVLNVAARGGRLGSLAAVR